WVDPATGDLRVVGVDFKTRELVRVSGAPGKDALAETRWRSPSTGSSVPFSSWAVGGGDAALDVEKKLGPRPGVVFDADELAPWHSELWALERRSRHAVASTSLPIR